MQGIVMRNLKKHNPLSKYFFNCLNDKNGENRTKNIVNDYEPLFIVILKSTFAEFTQWEFKLSNISWFWYFSLSFLSKILALGFSSHL